MNFSGIMNLAFNLEQERTSNERMTYTGHDVKVGASTVAGCARKAAFPILFGEEPPTLEEFFRMRKGNVAEGVVEGNLDILGIQYEKQGEYKGEGQFDFILVHPDIFIDANAPGDNLSAEATEFIQRSKDKGCDYILYELKTTNAIPSEPHDYWVRQTNLQAQYIADSLGIEPEKIDIYVYAIELNDGRNAEFNIEFEVEEVLIAQDDALSFASVIEDYIQYANKEKDAMEFTIHDVNRRVGNLCSICKFAHNCLGSGETVELPDDLARSVSDVKEWAKQEKNMKAHKEEVKQFMLNLGAKKAKTSGFKVTLKGGNKKDVINPDSYTDEEKLALAKKDANLIKIDEKQLSRYFGTEDDSMKWVTDEKHLKEKVSALSVMITEVKKEE